MVQPFVQNQQPESEPEPEPDICGPRPNQQNHKHQEPASQAASADPEKQDGHVAPRPIDASALRFADRRTDSPVRHDYAYPVISTNSSASDEKHAIQGHDTVVSADTLAGSVGGNVHLVPPASTGHGALEIDPVAPGARRRIAVPNLKAVLPKRDEEANEEAEKKKLAEPTWKRSFINTIKAVPILVAVPVMLPISWALHFTHQNPVAVFITSLLGIVPIAGGLSFATEELAHRMGDAWGGLLNATFGNAVELLIAILALIDGQIDIVQASMIGSILSNILLVLGMSYFAGGLRFHEQIYAIVGAQMHISLLGISVLAIVLPAAYHYAFPSTQAIVDQTIRPNSTVPEGAELDNLLKMSRGLSFILLAVYGMFLCFQLWTHAYLFRIPREAPVHPLPGGPRPEHAHVFPRPGWVPSIIDSDSDSSSARSVSSVSTGGRSGTGFHPVKRLRRWSRHRSHSDPEPPAPSPPLDPVQEGVEHSHPTHPALGAWRREDHDPESGKTIPQSTTLVGTSADHMSIDGGAEESSTHPEEEYKTKFWWAIGVLCAMTALAGVTAEWLVESIDGLTETGNVSREFVGLILLPVIGNSVEHITAVTVSVKDKLNLSMSIAVGSSIQVSLCLLPVLVLIGWAIGQPMLLFFDTFETIVLVLAVLLVNFAIADGRTNYLEGFIMMMAYLAIALVCWFYDPTV